MATKYVICHGWQNDPAQVHFLTIPDGCGYTSGQPNIEEFTSENEATLRAIELGYVCPEELDALLPQP